MQLFKRCRNLPAWHCAAGVQLFKQCRNLSARHCVAGVQLFKQCRNLFPGTMLQGCSCLSSVPTYLPALCCRGAAVLAVSQPICWHCAAGVQLFKQCPNLPVGTVLQGCSCLSSVATYLPALCNTKSCISTLKFVCNNTNQIYLHHTTLDQTPLVRFMNYIIVIGCQNS